MTSARATKRKRREARAPTPPPVGGRRRASPKVLIGAAVVVALIVLAIVLGFVLTGGSSSSSTPARGSLESALPGATDVNSLLKGIPQNGRVLGSPNAAATLVEYIDLQCPACQVFETQAMPSLIRRYVRTGKVKVEARPIAFIGPDSERGRSAALAAAQQNRFFNFSQLLYFNQGVENSGWLDDAMVKSAAASIPGLDVPRLLSARGSSTVSTQARALDAQAEQDDVRETPTILVGKSGGALSKVSMPSLTDTASIAAAIESAQR
ncbi:MAG TPA: thioredoxin domain-containing protein [Gaiellaceae bacterium]|jgi:protein-disulfide isomerase